MALSQILDIPVGSRFLEQNGGFACLTRGFVRLVLRGSVIPISRKLEDW
jgi:hypothetical protein